MVDPKMDKVIEYTMIEYDYLIAAYSSRYAEYLIRHRFGIEELTIPKAQTIVAIFWGLSIIAYTYALYCVYYFGGFGVISCLTMFTLIRFIFKSTNRSLSIIYSNKTFVDYIEWKFREEKVKFTQLGTTAKGSIDVTPSP